MNVGSIIMTSHSFHVLIKEVEARSDVKLTELEIAESISLSSHILPSPCPICIPLPAYASIRQNSSIFHRNRHSLHASHPLIRVKTRSKAISVSLPLNEVVLFLMVNCHSCSGDTAPSLHLLGMKPSRAMEL